MRWLDTPDASWGHERGDELGPMLRKKLNSREPGKGEEACQAKYEQDETQTVSGSSGFGYIPNFYKVEGKGKARHSPSDHGQCATCW